MQSLKKIHAWAQMKVPLLRTHQPLWSHGRIWSGEQVNMEGQNENHQGLYRGSYMRAHVLWNLVNKLRKMDKMWGLSSILLIFRNEFDNKFNNTRTNGVGSDFFTNLFLWVPGLTGPKFFASQTRSSASHTTSILIYKFCVSIRIRPFIEASLGSKTLAYLFIL